MAPRLIVLGWDSATFDVIDPMVAAGRLPTLTQLVDKGFRAGLRSTWPPMTDCAWTSAFTGLNPGAHGIFGSWYRAPGAYSCRYYSSRDRRAPAVWELTSGVTWLVWNVPMTFPPTPVDGVMVAGYGAPPGASFCEPPTIQAELGGRWPLDDILDRAPHGSVEDFLEDLLRGLEAQAQALPWAIRESGADAVVAVWPHIDRAQHFFWRWRGTDHPLAGAVEQVYEAMDRATGAIVTEFPEADVLVLSDHGAGSLKGDVNIGAWLCANGYAVPESPRRHRLLDLVWKLPPSVRRAARRAAPGAARRALGATLTGQLGHFKWGETRAFVGVHGDLWINLEGRESAGTVSLEEAPSLVTKLAAELLELRDPSTGERVFSAVHQRDEIYSGPALEIAPDLILDSWSAGYRVAPARDAAGEVVVRPLPLAGVNQAWSADHRPVGILVGAGPRIAAGNTDELALYGVCPTMLGLLEQPVPEGLDGRPATELMDAEWLDAHPIHTGNKTTARDAGGEYSEAEAAAVAAHLKDLGYIE
jgi:predicted AlkP superfamily phosphohydrolase/phosphomutase